MRHLFDLDRLSPTQLALTSILGSLLCPLSFGILYFSRRCCAADYRLIAAGILCLILGLILFAKASTQLTDDLRNERWTSTELQGLRATMQHPAWNYLLAALFAGQLAPFVFLTHHASVGLSLLIPFMVIVRVKAALRPPTARTTATPLWGNEPRPLQSEHWGER